MFKAAWIIKKLVNLMENSFIRFTIIQNNEAIVHNAACRNKCKRDRWEFDLKIRVIDGMELIMEIITEYSHCHTGLNRLKQPQCFKIDIEK